jgi:hypothetical protein
MAKFRRAPSLMTETECAKLPATLYFLNSNRRSWAKAVKLIAESTSMAVLSRRVVAKLGSQNMCLLVS